MGCPRLAVAALLLLAWCARASRCLDVPGLAWAALDEPEHSSKRRTLLGSPEAGQGGTFEVGVPLGAP